MRVIIFGAGGQGRRVYAELLRENSDVLCFCDNNPQKRRERIHDLPIIEPEKIQGYDYDRIAVASIYAEDMKNQLLSIGVPENKIKVYEPNSVKARIQWLRDFSSLIYQAGITGDVAEAGVFRGDFAKHINECFPDRALHLFDTFEGFPEVDVNAKQESSLSLAGYYSNTAIDIVMRKMRYPENIRVYKGYFPETADNVNGEFCFVNLDLDLYQPTLAGLNLFWKKICWGGVILVHDYFPTDYPGVKSAVHEFLKLNHSIRMVPIGDGASIALIK